MLLEFFAFLAFLVFLSAQKFPGNRGRPVIRPRINRVVRLTRVSAPRAPRAPGNPQI